MKPVARCLTTHPGINIDGYVVYGGSCKSPVITDADIYVGLDPSTCHHNNAYPWQEGYSFKYLIPDMRAPSNPKEFKELINWLVKQIRCANKVHIGCIGGHGRTGTVLVALVAVMTDTKDAIAYVRKHYCAKAVESQEQVDFLVKYYGVLPGKALKHRHIVQTPMTLDELQNVTPLRKSTSTSEKIPSMWGCTVVKSYRY